MNAKRILRGSLRPLRRSAALRRLGRRFAGGEGLRCVLYHEIADSPSEFTEGLGVTTAPAMLEAHLRLLAEDYHFVSIDEVLGGPARRTDRPALLVTFDDAYASIAHAGADICEELGVPSVFFVNGAFVGNGRLFLDNLVAWVVNTQGMRPLEKAAGRPLPDLGAFFREQLPVMTLEQRDRFHDELAEQAGIDPAQVAAEAAIYVTTEELRSLPARGMRLGNHTHTHVHGRILDDAGADVEIRHNQAYLSGIAGEDITTFSYPYGSRVDATETVTRALSGSGHRLAFLVDSLPNRPDQDPLRMYRVSTGSLAPEDLFTDIELLPALRRLRDTARR